MRMNERFLELARDEPPPGQKGGSEKGGIFGEKARPEDISDERLAARRDVAGP
jgi:hypothetical protein